MWVVIWGAVGALVAQQRSGETLGGFLMGVVLGPIGVLIPAIYAIAARSALCGRPAGSDPAARGRAV